MNLFILHNKHSGGINEINMRMMIPFIPMKSDFIGIRTEVIVIKSGFISRVYISYIDIDNRTLI